MKDTTKNTMKEIAENDLEKVTGSLSMLGFPGIGPATLPDTRDDDKPKDGGVTYTW